jgi:3-mercaptopyruvate sulfurtransferase SseA
MVRVILAALDKSLSLDSRRRLCADSQGKKTVSVEKFKELRDSGVPFFLVDVREPSEFVAGAIAAAVNIPMGEVEASGRTAEGPRDRRDASFRQAERARRGGAQRAWL